MDDKRSSLRVQSRLALAKVARQFAGSRIERQLLAQVFDVVWQAGCGGSCSRANDRCEPTSGMATRFTAASLFREGGMA